MNNFNFENLNVYKEALVFVDFVYKITNNWPKTELFSMIDQIKRAAISVVLNIAEGSSRTKKDFQHFITTSRGSVYECVAILNIAKSRKYISETDFINSYGQCLKLARMLSALKNSL